LIGENGSIHTQGNHPILSKEKHMKTSLKTILVAMCATLPFVAMSANAQTTRASCEADAKAQNLSGSERASFMKLCLPEGMKDAADAKPAKASKVSKSGAKKSKAKKNTKAKKKTTPKVAAVK
jgi:psiF repeat